MSRRWHSFLPVLLLAVVLAAPSSTAQTPPPSVTYELSVQPNAYGWHRTGVTVYWTVTPRQGLIRSPGCEAAIFIPGNTDFNGEILNCTAEWSGGPTISQDTRPIRIDKTPPTGLKVKPGRAPDAYGWYGHQVSFFFSGRDALSRIDRCPTKTYRRPNDSTASLTGFCQDRAGNVTKRTVRFKYRHPLISPPGGHKTWRPPLLDWIDVKNARFYNIQLWHNGKVLSKFRDGSRFQVPKTWWQDGVRRRLEPGRYRVYVWPRFSGRYGGEALRTSFVKR